MGDLYRLFFFQRIFNFKMEYILGSSIHELVSMMTRARRGNPPLMTRGNDWKPTPSHH